MVTEIIACPHCLSRVVPMSDGSCPACRKNTQETPTSARDKSEVLVLGVTTENQSLAKPNPAALVKDFQRALGTFTPRLIATPAIVIVNVLVFFAMVATGVHFFSPNAQSVLEWGANYGPKTLSGQWWRLVTCMFLHFGILHLAFNMWILWDLGRLVERMVGTVGFVLLYFVSGVAGSIASLVWNPVVISAGASGAVFGVAGALLGLLALRRDTIPTAVLTQLRNSMLAFLFYNVVYGITASGIDMAAHIGGLIAGLACGLILSQPLSIEMVVRRKHRNAVVLIAGTIVLLLAAAALPSAPPDMNSELQGFAEMEKETLDIYNALILKAQRGTVSDTDFAATIERDVLSDWVETRRRIESLIDERVAKRANLLRLVEYMKLREESWKLRVEAIREQDKNKLERADERQAAANEKARALSEQ